MKDKPAMAPIFTRLTKFEEQNKKMKYDGVHTCSYNCTNVYHLIFDATREIERLQRALRKAEKNNRFAKVKV